MSILGKLFGSSESTKELVGHISNGLDELKYTHEERAADHAKDVTEGRQLLIRWLESTTGSRLARRVIALTVTLIWSMQYVTAQILNIASVWSIDNTDKLKASALVITESAQSSNGAMMLVLGFYFAAPHLDKIVGPALERFGGKKQGTQTEKI